MFRSLRNRNYRLFASGQVVSNAGTWMQRVAQDWLVLHLSHDNGAALGLTTALQFLPTMVLGLWGGVIADRYPKRRLLMITQSAMGVLALVLGLLAISGTAQVWMVYLMAFALGTVSVVDTPVRHAFVAEMVGPRDLSNAIALNSAIFNLARVVGPAVAGLLIARLGGTGPAFLVNAASFVAVIAGLALMRTSELRPSEPAPRAKGQLREGLRYASRRPDLLLPIMMAAFVATFGMNFSITTALMAKEVFHAGADTFGVASSVFAVGALAGALLAAKRIRPNRRLLIGSAIAFGVLEIASGLAPGYWSFLVLLVPTGMALLTLNTAANATVQLGSDPEMRGRVTGLYLLVFTGGTPIGAPIVGWISEEMGARAGVVLGGALSLVGVGLAVALVRMVENRLSYRRQALAA
ncbi:MFS transporter [Bailinhaonella thermotolerans]|uniref:MFS transporter n=1 Tax=Bailinhaonella thermotolerans TaxID=1070861 RepID=A0A3A4AXN0_9ACTN|nr:MFS transporter [Bailinhaonella thermotolerans]RJL33169.1 MFS transporter [Bailinhaonella thermotolerans]